MTQPNSPQQPPPRLTARPQIYIDVVMPSGQQFSVTVDTAKQMRDELTLAIDAIEKEPETPSEDSETAQGS